MTTGRQEGTALADELLKRVGRAVGERANVSAVFGEPVEREGVTVIPVARARFAFGGGGGAGGRGGDEGSGAGGGGAAIVSPVGYVELRDGAARFRRITNPAELAVLAAAAGLAALALARLAR